MMLEASGYGSEKLVQFVSFDGSAKSCFSHGAQEPPSNDRLGRNSLLPVAGHLGSQTDDLVSGGSQVVAVTNDQS